MVPELKPQPFDIEAHLHHITRRWPELGQPLMMELVYLSADDQAVVKHVARYKPEDITQAADDAAAMNALGINAYVVVNPLDATNLPKAGRRASREHIAGAFYYWADADTAEAAENIRNFVGPKCTMYVLTGTQPCTRPHVYWEIATPTRDLPKWEAQQKAIAATLGTDSSVTDAPRIMRLAGTINWPKPQKKAKGYIAEVTTLRVFNPQERPPVPTEQMARAFVPAAPAPSGLQIDTGAAAPSLDRERLAIQAMGGMEWHNAVIRLVASYVGKGLSDGEIHALTAPLTLPGYTADQTHSEVQTAIDGARRKGWAPEAPTFTPNFDHAPAPTASDPAPAAPGWRLQSAAEFTADFIAPEYIVDGVIQRGRLYTLTAPTGSGKTAVMLYAATSIAEGTAFYDREVEQGDVIFMAGENPDDVRARMIGTMEFNNINPASCRVHFIPGTFSIRADLERIRAEAAKLPNLVLVVIDTFAAYFDGDDENSNAQALDFARVARQLTAFPSKPAVVMPAHPVKNATRGNLAPKGGSSLVNEVDGNLTLWNDGGIVQMHWQVKFRGPEFEPLAFELQRYETSLIRDAKGRLMPTILAKPMLQMRAMELATMNASVEDKLLLSIEADPALSLAERGVRVGVKFKTQVKRALEKMEQQKLIRRFRTNWELTKDGERAVEIIKNGGHFAPAIDA